MKERCGRWVSLASPAAVMLAAGLALVGPAGARTAAAQGITAFKDGYLTFTNANPALYYRVEFKPNLTGAEAWDGGYHGLLNIRTNAATVTVPVGRLYRVVGSASPVGVGTARASDILASKTVFVDGVEVTGTLPNVGLQKVTPGTGAQTILAGYHNGSGYVLGDSELVAANIRAGVTVFGVTGKTTVVDTSSGDAAPEGILSGKKAWVDGAEVVGTLPVLTLSPDSETVAAGCYWAQKPLTVVDPDLVTANIRGGVTVFGVPGKTAVVDTSSGTAAAADVLTGKKAWVDGVELTGTAVKLPYPASVAKTGAGDIAGYTAVVGEDRHAAMRRGVAWPSPRLTDNGNGTVTDNLTGLIWLRNANAFGIRNWATALTDCANLNSGEGALADGSVAGDWRLPNIQELQSLIDYDRHSPALPSGHPFTGVDLGGYWTGTTATNVTDSAWRVVLNTGLTGTGSKTVACGVWPVRGGQ